eukprot:6180640-Pleurochrysis_carterae.AAC.3
MHCANSRAGKVAGALASAMLRVSRSSRLLTVEKRANCTRHVLRTTTLLRALARATKGFHPAALRLCAMSAELVHTCSCRGSLRRALILFLRALAQALDKQGMALIEAQRVATCLKRGGAIGVDEQGARGGAMEGVGRCWKVLEGVGRCWKVLEGVARRDGKCG